VVVVRALLEETQIHLVLARAALGYLHQYQEVPFFTQAALVEAAQAEAVEKPQALVVMAGAVRVAVVWSMERLEQLTQAAAAARVVTAQMEHQAVQA
jgi:hypothetical protein